MSASTSQTQSAVGRSELVELLEKAIPSVENYTLQLTNIVAEEKYEQRSWTGGDNLRNQQATPEARGFRIGTRMLLSDFLTVWVPATSSWIEFRDVYEVDGKPVRERQARLESLFVAPAADAKDRARAIMDESARHNLGSIGRDFNMPTYIVGMTRACLAGVANSLPVPSSSAGRQGMSHLRPSLRRLSRPAARHPKTPQPGA